MANIIVKFLSTSCRWFTVLAMAAKTKLNGAKSLPIKRIRPHKKSRLEKVDHKPNRGVKNRTPSARHAVKNPVKKIISEDWVASKSFKMKKNVTGTETISKKTEIIVAVKLYFKKGILSIKRGILNAGGGVIALLKRAAAKLIKAVKMHISENTKKNFSSLLRVFNVMKKS